MTWNRHWTYRMHGNSELQLAILSWCADLFPAQRHALQILHDNIFHMGRRLGIGAGESQQACQECIPHVGGQSECGSTKERAAVEQLLRCRRKSTR